MNLTSEGAAQPKGSDSQASESGPTCAEKAVLQARGRGLQERQVCDAEGQAQRPGAEGGEGLCLVSSPSPPS